MGMEATVVMWPRCGEQPFVRHSYWGSVWNLALIGPVVSEEKMFKSFPYMSLCKTNAPGAGPFVTPGL